MKSVTDTRVSEQYVKHQSSTLLGDTKSTQVLWSWCRWK